MASQSPIQRHLVVWRTTTCPSLTIDQMSGDRWLATEVDCLKTMTEISIDQPVDVLLFPIDPYDPNSTHIPAKVLPLFANKRPVIMTYARSNPFWIGDFIQLAGADFHYYGVPPIDEILMPADLILDGVPRQTEAKRAAIGLLIAHMADADNEQKCVAERKISIS